MILGNSEIAFILIGFFVAINIIVLIFLIVSYRNILVLILNLNNTPSQTMTSLEVIIDRYLTKKKISELKVVRKPHQVLYYKRFILMIYNYLISLIFYQEWV